MRAAWYERRGPAGDVIETGEMPDPEPKPGEVRVQVLGSGVNPSDVGGRGGQGEPMVYARVIANSDGAGIIDRVGEGISEERIGERIWLYNGQRQGRAFGTAAEYISLEADRVAPLPGNASFFEGATLGIPCMTAHRCLFADGPVEGKTVLVTGGAGAVGHYAVQLAKWKGARVVATVSSDEKAAIAKAGGADFCVNYKTGDVAGEIEEFTGGDGIDRIVDVDLGANIEVSLRVLNNNSELIGYATRGNPVPKVPFGLLMGKNVALRGMILNSCPIEARRLAQREITEWITEGNAIHNVSQVFSLAETAAAHEHVESGTKLGTAVVDPQQ